MIGLPLSLSVNATAAVNFAMGGTLQTASGLSDLQVTGHVKPSATVDVNGLMTVSASNFARSGVRIRNALHTSSGLSGKLVIRGTEIVSIQLDAPKESTHVFSYDSQLFLLPNRPIQVVPIDGATCTPNWLGIELCSRFQPSHASVYLRKTDTHSSYVFQFERQGFRSLNLIMDTPQSQIDRKIALQFQLDQLAKTLRASFLSNSKMTELTGRYEYNPLMKAVDLILTSDSTEIASIRAALRSSTGRIEPSLIISQSGLDLIHFNGYYSYSTGSKYAFDLQLKHLTVKPIRFTGDISADSGKYDTNFNLKSYLIDASMAATIRRNEKMAICKTKFDYSIMEATSQNLEISTKYSSTVKGSLTKTGISAILQGSQYPQYDTDFAWELLTSDGYAENSVRLGTWELNQLYKVQPGVAQFRAAVTCRNQNIDWILHANLETNQAEVKGLIGWQLAADRKWSCKLDLTVQPQQKPARYAVQLELLSPTTNRQFRSQLDQQENQWELVIDYSTNKQIVVSFQSAYTNSNRQGLKMEHSINAKLRTWMTQDLQLTALLSASPTGTQLAFGTEYGVRKLTTNIEYIRHLPLEHSLNAQLTRDDLMMGQINFEASLTPSSGQGKIFVEWNGRQFEFSGQLSNQMVRALFKYPNRHPIRLELDYVQRQNVTAILEWEIDQSITAHLQLVNDQIIGQLSTPFAILPFVTLNGIHVVNSSQLDSRWTVDWQRDRIHFSLSASRTADVLQTAMKLSSSVSPLLEDISLDVQLTTTRPLHRFVMAVQHLGRRFELAADCRRRERSFSNASIRLTTPIRGYELMSVSVAHTQRVNSFQTDFELEGPLTFGATFSAGRKPELNEIEAKMAAKTNWTASSATLRVINGRSDKKFKLEAEHNGQHLIVADGAADLSPNQFRSQFSLNSAYTEQVTAFIEQRQSSLQGRVSWAGGIKNAVIILNGQFPSAANLTLNAPGLVSNLQLNHNFITGGQLTTSLKGEFNGRKADWSLNAKSIASDNLQFDSNLSLPYSGFEDLHLGVEHRRPVVNAAKTRLQISKNLQRFSLQHDVEFSDAFNWVNKLVIDKLFDLTNTQKWNPQGRLEHETEIVDKFRFRLDVDATDSGRITSSGSINSTWIDDVITFSLHHTDNGQQVHPILTIGDNRMEAIYLRGPMNPTKSLKLNWNSDRNAALVDWSIDWQLAMEKSQFSTRLISPYHQNVQGELNYDTTGPKKTALIQLTRGDQSLMKLEAFAAGQGSIYRTEVSLVADSMVQPIKAVAILDLANARISLQLNKNQIQLLRLQGALAVAPTQTSVSATIETQIEDFKIIKIESTLKGNRDIGIEIDCDGRKVSLSASYSAGMGKASAKGAIKSPFTFLQSAVVDASYDVSNPSMKTTKLILSRNERTIEASGQFSLNKLAVNIKAPCCGIRHFEASGSYDQSISTGRKTGHFKVISFKINAIWVS